MRAVQTPKAQPPQGARPARSGTGARPRVWIVTVGDEILRGDLVDTNSAFLSSQATALGMQVTRQLSVVDDEAAIQEVVRDGARQAELVLVTGGLGPTTDAEVRSSVVGAFDVPLARYPEAEAHVRAIFERRGRTLLEENLKQADLPLGSRMLANPRGYPHRTQQQPHRCSRARLQPQPGREDLCSGLAKSGLFHRTFRQVASERDPRPRRTGPER